MSKENVKVVTAFYEAWNAENMDAVREACDPEIEAAGASSRSSAD
jgi:hypothetical protein